MLFRYVRDKENVGRKADMTATRSDLPCAFGYGRHACLGRFFVCSQIEIDFGADGNEMKAQRVTEAR